MTILARDIEKIMDLSYSERLSPADGRLVLEYTKFIADLKALQEAERLEKEKEKKV